MTLKCEDGSPLPQFVLEKFRVDVFPRFLIRVLCYSEMYQITIEDISESWCQLIALPVRRAIYGILCGSDTFIMENQRGENPLQYDQIEIKSTTTTMYDEDWFTLPPILSSQHFRLVNYILGQVVKSCSDVKDPTGASCHFL